VRKVLHVIDSLDLGGAQTFLLELVKHHDRTRYLPEVACMHGRGVYAKAFEEEGIAVHSLSPGKFPPLYLPNFWRLMRSGGYDILHFHLFGANLCAKPLAIMAGHPAIIVHDQCNDASREKNPLLLAADAFWNRRSDRVIAVSESTRSYLLDREDLPDDLVTVIPNGIDAEVFKPASEPQREESRDAMGISRDCFVIGGVGRLVAQKNFTLFMDIAARVLSGNPSAVFVIAGTGPQGEELKAKAATLGIADRVRFLGHVSDRLALYHALDALLMTSDFEGTPMVLLEAMACGLPVVASAVDGIAEVCSDGKDAILVAPGDEPRFASSVECILRNPEFGRALGKEARNAILEGYEIRGLVTGIERVYDEVLSRHPHGKQSRC
jgi:glycosyltransferase involved in cell wall biosynthesis